MLPIIRVGEDKSQTNFDNLPSLKSCLLQILAFQISLFSKKINLAIKMYPLYKQILFLTACMYSVG